MTSNKLSSKLVLVVGLPRSGTTWLGKIFDSHPDTFYSHEPDSARPFRDVPLLIPPGATSEYEEAILREVEEMARLRSLRVVGKMPLFSKRYEAKPALPLRSMGLMGLKTLARFLGDVNVPVFLSGDVERTQKWIWKSIESSGRLGAVARLFPQAKVIFLIRHPCAVIASVLRGERNNRFSAGSSSEDYGIFELIATTKQARSRNMNLDRFYRMGPIARLAWRWALLNEFALESVDGLRNCYVVRYEDLCADPVGVAKETVSFAGLAWDPQVENFVRLSTTGDEGGYYSVFKNPDVSAQRWRRELDSVVTDEIMATVSETVPGRLYSAQVSGGVCR